ncbi:MAG TPA: hypothetical protein IAC15_04625 [Candidatus Onthomonas avicola]|nr:hypothetical protein [Candidatus Onthomonas avicola]
MKKLVPVLLAIGILFSLSVSALASDSATSDPVFVGIASDDDFVSDSDMNTGIALASSTGFSFTLDSGSAQRSSEIYSIESGKGSLEIHTATWFPGQKIYIGYYNINTGSQYCYDYTGGSIADKTITTNGVPSGSYKIYVRNAGAGTISGAISYTVH